MFTRALFRVARWIAGRARTEWLDAMAAEAEAIKGDSKAWALGCLWASIKDRFARDWWFAVAVVLALPLLFLWKGAVFFSTASLMTEHRIAPWFAVALWILCPFPIVCLFGQIRRGRSLYLSLLLLFISLELGPLLLLWMVSGMSPVAFFSAGQVNWYKADPSDRIGPLIGITLDALVWLAGAWLGSLMRRRARVASG
jgi:hypothetical protein